MSKVLFDVDDEGIATLTLADEAGKNAFSLELVAELRAALKGCQRPDIKVCILASSLEDVFCAGGDQRILAGLAAGEIAPYDLDLTRDLLEVPVPTIAAMRGHAVGGGFVFGICCDMVVLEEKARYGCNFMDLGFTPGMGATRLIQNVLGEHIAAEMLFTAKYFRGSHFVGRTHINYILPKAKIEQKVQDLALRVAAKPAPAIRWLKRSTSLAKRKLFEEARTIESMMHELCFASPELEETIAARYLQSPNT